MRIGLNAVRVAAAGFVVPYMAVYTPALMLQDGGPLAAEIGYWPAVAYIIFKALVAIVLWGAAAIGYLRGPARAVGAALGVRRGRASDRGAAADRRDRLCRRRRVPGVASLARARRQGGGRHERALPRGGGVALRIAATAFTLSWTHTVEKTKWLEHWAVEPDRLVLVEAQGGGLRRRDGAAARSAARRPLLRLDAERDAQGDRASPRSACRRLAALRGGRCDDLGDWLKSDADPVTLKPSAGNDCNAAPSQ